MKYYTIQNESILIADNSAALAKYYNNVQELPIDYEYNKYIIENGTLVINSNFENEQEQKEHMNV